MLRNRARYDPRAILTEKDAEKVLALAKKLIETLRRSIEER